MSEFDQFFKNDLCANFGLAWQLVKKQDKPMVKEMCRMSYKHASGEASRPWYDVKVARPAPYEGVKKFEVKLIKGSFDPKECIETRACVYSTHWVRLSFGDWTRVTHWRPIEGKEAIHDWRA